MRDALKLTDEEPKNKRSRQCLKFPDSCEPLTSAEARTPSMPSKAAMVEEPSSKKAPFQAVLEPPVKKELQLPQPEATPQNLDIEW